jgi:prophage regulatory protein
MSETAPPRLLRLPQVRDRIGGFSKVQIWRWRRVGRFPNPVRTGPGSVAWIEGDVDKWIADKIAARNEIEKGAAPVASRRRRRGERDAT